MHTEKSLKKNFSLKTLRLKCKNKNHIFNLLMSEWVMFENRGSCGHSAVYAESKYSSVL